MIYANDGTVGPGGVIFMNVGSIAEVEGIVIGLYGGKRF